MKKLIKVIAGLFAIAAFVAILVFYGTSISVKNVTVVNKTIENSKINKDTNIKIAFISDIHYNNFMNYDRFKSMIEVINGNKPDIILFGGDIFDNPSTYKIDDKTRNECIELLKSLEADYGKFAVLGEDDLNPDAGDIEELLFQADFELLSNEHILITKDGTSSINLIGIDSLVGGSPDVTNVFEGVDTSLYTIVVSHAPDIASQLPTNEIDLVLAGHSHGGQIALPFLGPISKVKGASNYSHGEYYINQTQLIVSNGLGTTDQDIRIFADPQCHMIRLASYNVNK